MATATVDTSEVSMNGTKPLETTVEEKQLANEQEDTTKTTTNAARTTETSNLDEKETAETFEAAQKYYELSKELLTKKSLEEAIEAGFQACNIGENSVEDANDIRLADFFMHYGLCLLRKMQQSKELLPGMDSNMNETEIPNDVIIDSTDAPTTTTTMTTTQDNEDTNEQTNEQNGDATNKSENNNEKNENENDHKTDTLHDTKNRDESENSVTEVKDVKDVKKSKNGKQEIEDDDENALEDIDIEISEKTDKNTENNENNNDNNNEINDSSMAEEDNNGENEESGDYALRATCWEMLDTARFIIQKYLETEFGIKFDENEIDSAETSPDTKESTQNTEQTTETNEKNEKNETNETKNDTNDSNNTVEKSENSENKQEQTEVTTDKTTDKAVAAADTTETTETDMKEEEKEELSIQYMLKLAECHMLCGEHQLEDSQFNEAIISFETAIALKQDCDDTNRELAFAHFMAGVAASHCKQLDIMQEHCNEAKDLIFDKILTIIDSFENEVYTKKTQDENLDLEGLLALVKEFSEEYKSKLDSLTETQKKDLGEIGNLVPFLKDIDDKMESELAEYNELKEIEAQEGQSIREIVLQALMSQNENQDNDNNNNNNNNNNNRNGFEVESKDKTGTVNEVSGIQFGSVNEVNNENKNEENSENSNEIVNTLVVKSKKTQNKTAGKKRSLEEIGVGESDDMPLKKKHKVSHKTDKEVNEVLVPIQELTTESKSNES